MAYAPHAAIHVTVRYGNGGYWDGTWKIAKLTVTPDVSVDDFIELVRNNVKKSDHDQSPWKRVTWQSFKLKVNGARAIGESGLQSKEYELWDGEGVPPENH